MIHLTRSMPSGNLDESVTSPGPQGTVPVGTSPRSYRLPAEYYTAPVADVRPLFPKWVPIGCGTVSAVILVILFVGGAIVSGPRLAQMMDFVVGTSLGELKGMYTKDVSAQQKAQFDAEVNRLREGLRSDKVSVQNLQPFLKAMQSAISDKSVTPDELAKLTKAAHDATAKGNATPRRVEEPPPHDTRPLAH